MLRIGTHNVNGIRAAYRRGFADWLPSRDLDVLALQEVRCPPEALPLPAFGDYQVIYVPGNLAGRNGVALLTKHLVAAVRSWGKAGVTFGPTSPMRPLGDTFPSFSASPSTSSRPSTSPRPSQPLLARELHAFADEGRYLEIDLADVAITIACLYLPKGGLPQHLNVKPQRNGLIDPKNPLRYNRKMSFLTGFARQLTRSRRTALRAGREFLVLGDFNIAHTKQDLKNWRTNQASEGFLPEERAWFTSILSDRTLHDVVRALNPNTAGPYSWWSWMGNSFTNDVGWRIDYHLATPRLASLAKTAFVDREQSAESRLSDHAPVIVEYDNW